MRRVNDFDADWRCRISMPPTIWRYWLVRNAARRPGRRAGRLSARLPGATATFSGGDIRPWLLAIVRNVAYRWLAVRQRTSNVVPIEEAFNSRASNQSDQALAASEEPSAEALMIGAQERALVLDALAKLPPAIPNKWSSANCISPIREAMTHAR